MLLLPKPVHDDVAALREGQVLWGRPHCAQDEMTSWLPVCDAALVASTVPAVTRTPGPSSSATG